MMRAHRPRIGICTALERARWTVWDREAFLLSHAYVDALHQAGAIALMLPPDPWAEEHPDDILDGLDGLLLAGGGPGGRRVPLPLPSGLSTLRPGPAAPPSPGP